MALVRLSRVIQSPGCFGTAVVHFPAPAQAAEARHGDDHHHLLGDAARGLPTRLDVMPAQITEFFDCCGGLWAKGALIGNVIFSYGSQGGGNETIALPADARLDEMFGTGVPASGR
ncbi:hypothetical protein PHYSODRAFT_329877 [Phytophthora sojae]|uniref:Uncharacterized protein n=1 Tax=Phytophthora sojae (strain P6497) TaxID=1094619 RepID=G4ZAB3_PHYSP|nr:hypothetical protein PHYSODRAFT_329877 [Phytophthora sojae]EGZ21998.1 hypothetical protein PHYSODRAFT_329877 [Phytophthora sojae]|eukprot:XP_009524715.1 hypothetical protein PHYSODRAFT_329877 [Phytophthora sojae]